MNVALNNSYPRHVAIIMDGNGRWAKKHRLPRIAGHQKGAESARHVIENLIEYGVPYVTLYVFSTENWNRPREEVEGLFSLLEANLKEGLAIAMEKQARLHHLGNITGLEGDLIGKLKEAEEITRNNTSIDVVLAFNYGGRDELVEALRKIAASGIKPGDITEDTIRDNLFCPGIPDPDLVISTGGEMRLSNFLLWQSAYAEIYFTPVLWPEFDKKELAKAIEFYSSRQRRFGGLGDEGVESE
ncbi:MAG: di-trans,poly-cis-decaprenylcistransferase [Chloroflexi bacterium RBG_16_48_7]|nr:MAG: di-trans,poly-cis-decaprenylcistransferase [Chloroflexi bacterium RBG_16_48_7]